MSGKTSCERHVFSIGMNVDHKMVVRRHRVKTNGMFHGNQTHARQVHFEKILQSFEITRMTFPIDVNGIDNGLAARVFRNLDRRSIKTWKAIKRAAGQFEQVIWQPARRQKFVGPKRKPADKLRTTSKAIEDPPGNRSPRHRPSRPDFEHDTRERPSALERSRHRWTLDRRFISMQDRTVPNRLVDLSTHARVDE